ncbi:hypothetical protein ACIBG8_42590 [Nonomuraea sp. NPDC050556]|uniref:hypothetical protein n=1 Tax=Nonomuraea sp. NPDC050556 TaxID=3364369 RepID=UPI0037A59381
MGTIGGAGAIGSSEAQAAPADSSDVVAQDEPVDSSEELAQEAPADSSDVLAQDDPVDSSEVLAQEAPAGSEDSDHDSPGSSEAVSS